MNTSVTSISPQRLHAVQSQGGNVELMDVRTPAEFRAGHAVGTKLIALEPRTHTV